MKEGKKEALQITEQRRETKGQGERERYIQLNTERYIQLNAGKIRRHSLMNNVKK